jgi:hypothetical protein
MDHESTVQRTKIKQEIWRLLSSMYGAQSTLRWFREINRKQWRPGGKVRPSIWITDAGTVASNSKNQSDTVKAKILSIRLVLDLESHFSREGTMDDWSDRAEQIAILVQNFSPQCGVYRCDVTRDEPMDVVIQDGSVEAIWEIELEMEYFYEVRAFGPA